MTSAAKESFDATMVVKSSRWGTVHVDSDGLTGRGAGSIGAGHVERPRPLAFFRKLDSMRRTTQTSMLALATACAFAMTATPAFAQATGDTDTPAADASSRGR